MNKFIILIPFLLFGCKYSQKSEPTSPVIQYLDYFNANSKGTITILYLDGCSGCIELYRVLLETVKSKNDNITFILTKSPKKAKLLFGDELIANAYFDTEFLAFKYSLIENFPVIYNIDSDSIIETSIIKSNEDIFKLEQ